MDDCRDLSLPTRGEDSLDFVLAASFGALLELLLEVVESSRLLSLVESEADFDVDDKGLLL